MMLKQLNSIEDLVGKVIKKATIIDNLDGYTSLVILFEGSEFCHIQGYHGYSNGTETELDFMTEDEEICLANPGLEGKIFQSFDIDPKRENVDLLLEIGFISKTLHTRLTRKWAKEDAAAEAEEIIKKAEATRKRDLTQLANLKAKYGDIS